ncbi:MAG: prolipoprotein diacylglyceryl transferase [Oscillospiraceae bacterium]|nr:prolipoprotein diacylglyceryl transferase [Oscillospiraceae bacterium]
MEIPGITFPLLGDFEWNFLPYFTVFGWKIYWYGVIIAVGFLLAVIYSVKHAKEFGLTEDDVIDTLIWAVPLGIIGARLYYVIFYRDASGANPYFDGYGDIRDIIAIWEGGLAIYGGVIGGVIGLVIATRMKKISSRAMLDTVSFGLLIGQAIGRWGNFTNREAHGTETMVPWRMGLVYSYKTFYYHPTFLYESLWNVLGFLLLHFVFRKRRKFDGQLFLCYLAWYGLGRLFIEGLRTDSLYVGSTNLRVSQLLAGLTCLIAAATILYVLVFRHPEPEELWLNRDKKSAPAPAPAAPPAEETELMSEEQFDVELSDAFRILGGGKAAEDRLEEAVEDAAAGDAVDSLSEAAEQTAEALAEAEEASAETEAAGETGPDKLREDAADEYEREEAEATIPDGTAASGETAEEPTEDKDQPSGEI